jgi:hypothetical protein
VDSFGRGYSVFRSLYEREPMGNFGIFKLCNRVFHPGGRAHCFSLLAKLDCIELASPSLRRKCQVFNIVRVDIIGIPNDADFFRVLPYRVSIRIGEDDEFGEPYRGQ